MKKLTTREMEMLEGGVPFWGSTTTCSVAGSYLDVETGDSVTFYQSCTTTYRAWINFGTTCTAVYSCNTM